MWATSEFVGVSTSGRFKLINATEGVEIPWTDAETDPPLILGEWAYWQTARHIFKTPFPLGRNS